MNKEIITELSNKIWNLGGQYTHNQLDELIAGALTTHDAQLWERLEGMKTKNTDGKTYYDNHPDVARDKALTDAQAVIKPEI
jgi:hypothetical protein